MSTLCADTLGCRFQILRCVSCLIEFSEKRITKDNDCNIRVLLAADGVDGI